MPFHELAGVEVLVDEEGFLTDKDQWTPAMAEVIADELGVSPLTERHWKVITCCREETATAGQVPDLRRISKVSEVGMEELRALFSDEPGRIVARISGLSKPRGCK